jgi:hypothetical protein
VAQFVYFGILTPANISSRDSGRVIVKALIEATPDYVPEKYSYYEPINRRFDPANIDEALDAWRFSFVWRRTRPRVEGTVFFGGRRHGSIHIAVAQKSFVMESALRFLHLFQRHFPVDLSYVHVAHDGDLEDLDRYQRQVEPFMLGLGTPRLRGGLPDLPWAMGFGRPYIELFGRDRIVSAPAPVVREMGGLLHVQLTDDVKDAAVRTEAYWETQRNVKRHLNNGAFAGGSSSGVPRVPDFLPMF